MDAGRGISRAAAVAIVYAATVTSFSAALVLHRAYRGNGAGLPFDRALLWQGVVYFSWAALVPLLWWAGRRFSVGRNAWIRPLPAFLAASVLLIPLHALLTAWITWLCRPTATVRPPWQSSIAGLFVERLPIDLLIYWGIVGALYAVLHYRALRRQELAAAAMETQLARAQLHALSAGLQPHFLFNALQAISTLVRRRPDDAVRMIAHLGDLLRESLRRSGQHTVSLRDELTVLQHYLAIEGVRLGERLRVDIDIDASAGACHVPTLLLQPIVENAVRHGLSEKPEGGSITVRARSTNDRLHIIVEDTGVGLPVGRAVRDGIGLSNTRERLRQLHGEAATLHVAPREHGEGTLVTVELPCTGADSNVKLSG